MIGKLGWKPRKPGIKGPLRIHKYLGDLSLVAPASVSRASAVKEWGMYFNDEIGDCTMAAVAHMLMLITSFTGNIVVPDASDIRNIYFQLTGGVDSGLDLPTVLDYWRDTGIAGHKILNWGDIDPQDMERQRQAMWAFGAVDQAAMLPMETENQFDAEKEWTITDPNDAGNLGGHSIPCFDYKDTGDMACVTWARVQWGNPGWWIKYLVESCAVITPEWIANADGLAPGFPTDTLIADLKAMGSWTNV